jgi:hypothetical protein
LLIDVIPPLRSRQPVLQGFLFLWQYWLSDRFVLPLFGAIRLRSGRNSVMIVRCSRIRWTTWSGL